ELGYRLTGSSDLYELSGRRPYASVNYVTAHDGFTLADLVSYQAKHNAANGEGNRDGTDNNISWNGGVEGPTDDPKITDLRQRRMRNFVATLLLSQGTPMLCAGDEIGRSQGGNNNAYCQDNEVSWFPWPLTPTGLAQLEFTRRLIRLRIENPAFHRRAFFHGRPLLESSTRDLVWIGPDGKELSDGKWSDGFSRCLGMLLAGNGIQEVDETGQRIAGDTFLVLLNAHHEALPFTLPAHGADTRWDLVLDTRGHELDHEGRP